MATWANSFQKLVVVLKQSSSFKAFVVDQTVAPIGSWGTTRPGQSTNDLSHGLLYPFGKSTTSVVPLPAALWLMLTGAVSLVAAGSRRRHRSV